MLRHITLIAIVGLVACESRFPSVYTPTAPTPPPDDLRSIQLGDDVHGRVSPLHERHPLAFEVLSPSDGLLIVTLKWDVDWNGTLLRLTIGDEVFKAVCCDWSPIVGSKHVEQGERIRIFISVAGSDWSPDDPFVLKTVIK